MMSAATRRLMAAIDKAIDEGKPHAARTAPALASVAHCSVVTALRILPAQHTAGLLHIEAWVRVGRAGPLSAVYAPGVGEDEPFPQPTHPGKRKTDWRTSPSGQRILQWFSAGHQGGTTAVMTACNTSHQTAWELLQAMHASRVLRIAGWQRQWGGRPQPQYSLRADNSRDVPRPAALSVTERRSRHKRQMAAFYGPEVASVIVKCMYGRAPIGATVMVDGKPIYTRGLGLLRRINQEVSHD